MSQRILRVGVVGCGQIAQLMHLPHLKRLPMFEIGAMCDLSPTLVEKVADHYGVERRYTDHRALLEQRDLDVVFVATHDHAPVSIDAANAGKHVMSEKPIAFNLEDADRVIAAARSNRVKLQIAYMKRYDPAFEYALPLFKAMKDVKLIRIHDFGGAFDINEKIYDTYRSDDIPAAVAKAGREKWDADLVQAVGQDRADLARTYNSLLHLSTHDATILRGAFGDPEEIQFADCFANGLTVAVMRYGQDTRCVWESGVIRDPWPWDESLTAYGAEQTIRVQFPYPYLHNAASTVHVNGREGDTFVERTITAGYDEAFRREWKAFYECITQDRDPLTNAEEARADVKMLVDMIKAVRRP
jgi:predicted dehydrogenase